MTVLPCMMTHVRAQMPCPMPMPMPGALRRRHALVPWMRGGEGHVYCMMMPMTHALDVIGRGDRGMGHDVAMAWDVEWKCSGMCPRHVPVPWGWGWGCWLGG